MDWIGILALIMATFAIIIIIIAIYIFQKDNQLIISYTDRLPVKVGSVTSPESIVGLPNSIYVVNSGIVADFTCNVTPYPDISSIVTMEFTTQFTIDNTTSKYQVTVIPPGGTVSVTGAVPDGITDPSIVKSGTSATFIWFNSNSIKRLR